MDYGVIAASQICSVCRESIVPSYGTDFLQPKCNYVCMHEYSYSLYTNTHTYKLRNKAEKMYGIINGKINFRANKYEVMRGLWKGLAVPSVMYGLEIMEVGGKEKRGLEIVQNRAARRGLGANRHVATEALRGEMGWSTFQERIDKTKINYRVRLEHMSDKRWAKKVFEWRGNKSTFKKEI